jgi:hypothetical protein
MFVTLMEDYGTSNIFVLSSNICISYVLREYAFCTFFQFTIHEVPPPPPPPHPPPSKKKDHRKEVAPYLG